MLHDLKLAMTPIINHENNMTGLMRLINDFLGFATRETRCLRFKNDIINLISIILGLIPGFIRKYDITELAFVFLYFGCQHAL